MFFIINRLFLFKSPNYIKQLRLEDGMNVFAHINMPYSKIRFTLLVIVFMKDNFLNFI